MLAAVPPRARRDCSLFSGHGVGIPSCVLGLLPSRPCSEVFNSAHDLTISDLSFQGDHFSLFPRHSKSDRCGKRGFCSCGLH